MKKPSGVEWVGEIPTDWDVEPFFKVMPETGRSNSGLTESNLLSLSYGQIIRKDIDSNDGLLPASFETYQIVEPGDIIFRFTDLQNDKRSLRSALVRERGIITSAYLAVSPKACLPAYADFLMRSYDTTKVFYSFGGGVRQSLKYSDVKRLPVLLPPIDTQRVIVEFLDHETAQINALISKQEQLVEVLAERRSAMVTHAVTRGINSEVELKESGSLWFGTIPENWKLVPCGSATRLIQTGPFGSQLHAEDYVDDGVPVINPSHLIDGRIVPDVKVSVSAVKALELARHRLDLDDVVVGRRGELGRCAVVGRASVGFLCGTGSALVRLRPAEFDCRFFQLVFGSEKCQDALLEYSVGATMDNLSASTISHLRLPRPPVSEQRLIVDFLDREATKIDTLIDKAKAMNVVLRERRSALISATVTGKIDVTKRTVGVA